MIDKTINYNGKEYYQIRRIKGKKSEYVEYVNDEIRKIKFFEIEAGSLCEVKDKRDLDEAIKKNYLINQYF
jgi:hypothetical protein